MADELFPTAAPPEEKPKRKRTKWPAERSLNELRRNGWTVAKTEYYMKHPGMPFGRRVDVWGFGDLLACRPETFRNCNWCFGQGRNNSVVCDRCMGEGKLKVGESGIALVQCCAGNSHAEHKEKILGISEYKIWKAAGGRVFLQSWAKRGARGEVKTWQMREEEL